jgi:hypothetical protein
LVDTHLRKSQGINCATLGTHFRYSAEWSVAKAPRRLGTWSTLTANSPILARGAELGEMAGRHHRAPAVFQVPPGVGI